MLRVLSENIKKVGVFGEVMNKIFEKKYDLRASDFDRFDRIMPSSVLELFQDVACWHADEIGTGYDAMIARSYVWVLVKIRFRILKNPEKYQSVVVRTWPLEPNKFIYRREYIIENESGEKLICGSSEWVVMHSEKRRLVLAPDLYSIKDGFCKEMNFEQKLDKVEDFEESGTPYSIMPGFSQLDGNSHVNNTKYTNFVLDAVNPQEASDIDEFQIDYRKEVLQGVKLDIYHTKKDNIVIAKGLNEDRDTMFACKIVYK